MPGYPDRIENSAQIGGLVKSTQEVKRTRAARGISHEKADRLRGIALRERV